MLVKDLIQEYSVRNKEKKDYPVYSVTNSQGFCKDYFGKEVASKDKSTYKIVPYGCFAYNPSRINVGSIDWQHCEDFVIVSPLYNVFTVNTNITRQDYLSYYFKSHLVSDYINTFAKGSVRLNVPLSTLGNFPVPIPPLAEQERIVAELDLLSSIIDKKKAQLKELDQLAQSFFYDMFGDPITNEKGWEVKKLGECLSYIKNGANIKQTKGASGIPITRIETLSGGIFNRDRLGYADIMSTERYSQYVMEDMDILMSHINSKAYIGRSVVYRKQGDETIIHGMNLLKLKVIPSILVSIFLDYFFKSDYFKDRVARIRKDAVNQSSMAISDLVKISICVPPLPLQQEFASKIEAIERQKSLIQQSIVETQTLFDSRMDYWFG